MILGESFSHNASSSVVALGLSTSLRFETDLLAVTMLDSWEEREGREASLPIIVLGDPYARRPWASRLLASDPFSSKFASRLCICSALCPETSPSNKERLLSDS